MGEMEADNVKNRRYKPKPVQMVWASIWLDKCGRPRRSPLVIMERDSDAPRGG